MPDAEFFRFVEIAGDILDDYGYADVASLAAHLYEDVVDFNLSEEDAYEIAEEAFSESRAELDDEFRIIDTFRAECGYAE